MQNYYFSTGVKDFSFSNKERNNVQTTMKRHGEQKGTTHLQGKKGRYVESCTKMII